MLIDKKIEINISYRNVTHYIKLGYNPIINKQLIISTEHLPSNSHVRIYCVCELCGEQSNLRYHKYLENKKRHNYYSCKGCSRQKAVMTTREKYGVDNYIKTDEFKLRLEKTNLMKYGYKTNLIHPDFKKKIKKKLYELYGSETFYNINRFSKENKLKFKFNDLVFKLKNDIIYSEELFNNNYITNEYLLYRNECRKLTKRKLKELYKNWNGYDFYTNEYLVENFKLNYNDPGYPTVDHKKSIYYGFINKLSTDEISSIDNLCITSRSNNSKKRDLSSGYLLSN